MQDDISIYNEGALEEGAVGEDFWPGIGSEDEIGSLQELYGEELGALADPQFLSANGDLIDLLSEQGAVKKAAAKKARPQPKGRLQPGKPDAGIVRPVHIQNGRLESYAPILRANLHKLQVADRILDRINGFEARLSETGEYEAFDGTANVVTATPATGTEALAALIMIGGSEDETTPNRRITIEGIKTVYKNGVDGTDGTVDTFKTTVIVRPIKHQAELLVALACTKRIGNGVFSDAFVPVAGAVSACNIKITGVLGLRTEVIFAALTDPAMQWLAKEAGVAHLIPAR